MALVAQAPLRISFGGGGTDLAAYYRRYGGIVVSAAVNRYVYAIVSDGGRDSRQIISPDDHTIHDSQLVIPNSSRPRSPAENLIWDGDLALPKAVLAYFGVKAGVDIDLASELPAGTGLGSSGSVAVSLVAAVSAWLQRPMDKDEIAEIACHVEIDRLGMPVGKQDPYAAAFGGLNVFTFAEGGVGVEPIRLDPDTFTQLQRSILLFDTGQGRDAAGVLKRQRHAGEQDMPDVIQRLHHIKALGLEVRDALVDGDIRAFGQLMHQSWLNEHRLAANAGDSSVDAWYDLARRAGALGGKITGADGGGFLMLVCPLEAQAKVAEALGARGLRRMDVAFDFEGARVVSTETAPVPVRQ